MIVGEVVVFSFHIIFFVWNDWLDLSNKVGLQKQMGNKNSKAHKSFSGAHKH